MFYRLTSPVTFAPGKPLPVSKPAPVGKKVESRKLKAERTQVSSSSPGEGSAPLSNTQKAKICILAKDAWIAVGPEEDFETWRHGEQAKACGVSSLVVACQRDYLSILGHFQRLAGENLRAARSEIQAATGPWRTAWHILGKELLARGLPQAYAAAIAKTQFKKTLGECSDKQLWCLIKTVRNRRKPAKATPAGKTGEDPF